MANAMASAGITTLVPDKRLDNYTMLHRDYVSSAHDYAKSLEILRKWPGVSRSETGIYAESEGTWIATVLTQQHPDLAFAILTSPPVVSGRQQMTLAATNYLTAAGAPDAVKQLIPRITSLAHNAWDSPMRISTRPNTADRSPCRYSSTMASRTQPCRSNRARGY